MQRFELIFNLWFVPCKILFGLSSCFTFFVNVGQATACESVLACSFSGVLLIYERSSFQRIICFSDELVS